MQPTTEDRSRPEDATTRFPRVGLATLEEQRLGPHHRGMLRRAHESAGGSPVWVRRKVAEGRDLLALAELAPHRLRVDILSLGDELKAIFRLRLPVAVGAAGGQDVDIVDGAVIGLSYPREALLSALPGYSFVCVLAPHGVWHPQVSRVPPQRLCLGDALPAGIRVKELILMTYAALSMQSHQLDAADAAGVLNLEATRWWQENVHRIPLTTAPFLADPGLDGEGRT